MEAKSTSPAFLSAPPIPRFPPKPHFLSLTSLLPRRTLRSLSSLNPETPETSSHKTLVLENIHRVRRLKHLLTDPSAAVNSEELLTAANFLIKSDRPEDALHLFNEMLQRTPSLSSPSNFSKLALLFSASPAAAPQAFSLLSSMTHLGFPVPLSLYNSLLSALAAENRFDEMGKLVKRMKSSGVSPNWATFNLLIVGFARGGLLVKMESAYGSILSGKMSLGPEAMEAMIGAYADVCDIPKMEKIYRRLLSSSSPSSSLKAKSGCADLGEYEVTRKTYRRSSSSSPSSSSSSCGFSEDLIRKMAMVYIKNSMFSRLEDLANDLSARKGRTHLYWLLLLLASALIMSRRGMDSILSEMRSSMIRDDISFINIMAMAHARMKGFRDLEGLFLKMGKNGGSNPDLITLGIFFDACSCGFDGGRVLDAWKRLGFLERRAEMPTDSLVIAAFGKGKFVETCKMVFEDHDHNHDHDHDHDRRKNKDEWTYVDLITRLSKSGKLI